MAADAFMSCFGPDEDVMKIETPTQSLRRLLEEKARGIQASNQSTNIGSKRLLEKAKGTSSKAPSPQQQTVPPLHVTAPSESYRHKFWLGFGVIMEALAKDEGLEALCDGETVAERVTRGLMKYEVEEFKTMAVTFPMIS
ncbi:hypothetical protein M758_UG203600 [Ceratodon purpureus]|nr:hypothetical protein M758_UG203600 [Ceratodon purpureus]